MPTLIFEVPEDSDFWPCPEGCGGATEDAGGGPCKACWRRLTARPRCGCDPSTGRECVGHMTMITDGSRRRDYFPEGTEP